MKPFICDNCGTKFTKYCPVCFKNDDLDLIAYCKKCKKLTLHEDGYNPISWGGTIFCTECDEILEK